MDFPPGVSRLLADFRSGLAQTIDLDGLYVYGSLTAGDFSFARSDIDVIAVTGTELDRAALERLRTMHARLASADSGSAKKLHCLYVPSGSLGDPERLHHYWFGDRFTQWQLKVLTQAELAHGRALYGEWPVPGLPPVSVPELQAAVREEFDGYWRQMAARRAVWLEDSWVDLGLVTLPRAAAVLEAGELITKGEAIRRIGGFGASAALAADIRRRRDGDLVRLSRVQRLVRAWQVRRIMIESVRRLAADRETTSG